MVIDSYFLLHSYMRLTANKIAGILRDEGYKLTPQRHAILKTIAASPGFLTPESIYEKTYFDHPKIGLVTVYRTLEILSKLNLICQVHTPDGGHGYMMRRPTEHHHHIVCSSCNRTIDFTGCLTADIETRLKDETGFRIKGHLLEFYGVCPGCQSLTDGK